MKALSVGRFISENALVGHRRCVHTIVSCIDGRPDRESPPPIPRALGREPASWSRWCTRGMIDHWSEAVDTLRLEKHPPILAVAGRGATTMWGARWQHKRAGSRAPFAPSDGIPPSKPARRTDRRALGAPASHGSPGRVGGAAPNVETWTKSQKLLGSSLRLAGGGAAVPLRQRQLRVPTDA